MFARHTEARSTAGLRKTLSGFLFAVNATCLCHVRHA